MEKEFLLKLAEDVSTLAEDIRSLAEACKAPSEDGSQEEKVSPPEKAQAEVIPSQEPDSPEKAETKAPPEEKTVTLPEVRAVLAEKSREGHTEEVKALIKKHGADRLSEVDPSQYPALLKKAEVI
jgi:phage gp29-like protein